MTNTIHSVPREHPVKVCSECLQQDCNGECINNLD